MIGRKHALLASLILILAVLGGWLSSRFDGAGPTRPEASPTLSDAAAATPTPRRAGPMAEVRTRPRPERTPPAPASPKPATPRSKRTPESRPAGGSAPPAHSVKVEFRLAVTKDGRFAPTSEAVKLFDCFWSSRGEASIEILYDRIAGEIRAQLPKKAEAGAIELFDTYVGYRKLASRIRTDILNGMPLPEAYEQLRNLRQQTFGGELAGNLFGAQEEVDQAEIESYSQVDADLASVWEQMLEVKKGVPTAGDKRYSRQEMMAIQTGVHRYVAEAMSAEKLRAMFGGVIAQDFLDRIVQASRSRAAFASSWAEYWDARREAETTAGVNCEGRSQILEALRTHYFSPEEAARVKLLDSIEFDQRRPK